MFLDLNKLFNGLYSAFSKFSEAVFFLFNQTAARWYVFFIVLMNLANWFLAYYVNHNVSQSLVILHYNVNLGVNLIGNVVNIYMIPAIGLTFIIVNLLLLLNLWGRSRFFIHFLLGFSLLVEFFLIASTISIYLINFR